MKIIGLYAILTGALVSPAAACDLCSIYAATEAQGGSGKGFFGGVAEQYTYFSTLQDSGRKIANDGEFIHSSVAQVFAGYSFNDRLSLQLNVPIIYRSFGSDTDRGHNSGISDISLIGNYIAYQYFENDWTFSWNVLGGVKFPTGNPNRLNDPDFANGIGGHDLALGSGSYDGIVGTSVSGSWKRLFMTAGLQYAIRSEGSFEHQYANDLTWSGGPGVYLALAKHYTLALQCNISGETKGKDTFSGVEDDDSAETIVYAGPQVSFTWRKKLAAQAGVDIPVSIYNSGVQLVPDYRAHAALTWRF